MKTISSSGGTPFGNSGAFILAALLMLLPCAPAGAAVPTTLKLHARNIAAQTAPEFGSSVAVGDTYVLVGEPGNDDDGADPDTLADLDSGAVHVFNATTGAYVWKLRALDAAAGAHFGASVAVSANLAVIGAPRISAPGKAYVFNLATGAQLQMLVPSDGVSSDVFGCSVSLSGSRALIGASGHAALGGAAYVFDVVGGPELRKLVPSDGAINDKFGVSVALSGNVALVGAQNAAAPAPGQGAAYVFDAISGAELHKLTASDGIASDQLGCSVALHGRRALVGAKFKQASRGAAYVFDVVRGGAFLQKLAPADLATNDRFGFAVALCGNLALIGAPGPDVPGTQRGSAYLYDAVSGTLVHKVTAADGLDGDLLGYSVALYAARAVIGARHDDNLVTDDDHGSAYFMRPVAGPFPMETVAVLRGFAPGAPETSFATFGDAFIDDEGEVIFPGTLMGTGAAGGKNLGIWDTLAPGEPLDLVMRSGVDLGVALNDPAWNGRKATSVTNPLANQPNFAIFQATLVGTGVTLADNRALFADTGTTLTKLLRLDEAPPLGDAAQVAQFIQMVQPMFDARQAVVCRLKTGTGSPLVNASSDTGITVLDNAGNVVTALTVREGGNLNPPIADQFGQFSRVSFQHTHMVGTTALTGATTANQAVVKIFDFGLKVPLVRKGGVATDANGNPIGAGVNYSVFTGETTSFRDEAVFRATLALNAAATPPVTSSNDQGLWYEHSNQVVLAVREGQQVSDQNLDGDNNPLTNPYPTTGVVWNTFLNFWAMDVGTNPPPDPNTGQVLFLATIRGPGVTIANDTVLCLLQENGTSLRILLREGDPAPDCGGATIGVIQRVVASPYFASYAVLVSLTNAPVTSNQALLFGRTVEVPTYTGLNAKAVLRRPFLVLRKGALYQSPLGTTTSIRSMTLPASAFDATGAGGKGLGLPINSGGEVVLPVTFTDNAVHLVKVAP